MNFSRDMTRLWQRFGHAAQRATRPIAGLGELTQAERTFLHEMSERVLRRVSLTAAQSDRVAGLLARMTPQYRVRMLVSAGDNAFLVPGLQEIFLRETAGSAHRPSVTDWIRNLDAGSEAHGLLRWLCGTNYRAQATLSQGLGTHLLSAFSIPAPPSISMSPEQVVTRIMGVAGARDALFERLGRALLDPDHRGAGATLLATGRVSRGLFSILKGNVAELLARDEILDVLRRGEQLGTLPEGAVLVTGIRLRRPGSARSTLFSDGLIGVMEGDRWRWIGAVEVKGYHGGFSDGVAQVTRWREISSLESAFELEFGRGAVVTTVADGSNEVLTSPRRFAFDPAAAATSRISIEGDGVRHLVVAPLGDSLFDLAGNAGTVPPHVIQIPHPISSDAIDHMTAVVLQTVAGETSLADALRALRVMSGG